MNISKEKLATFTQPIYGNLQKEKKVPYCLFVINTNRFCWEIQIVLLHVNENVKIHWYKTYNKLFKSN